MVEITNTVSAYGSCVSTWLMWLQPAPAEAMMVVSEIGEQWSPHTPPAMQAEITGIIISGRDAVIALSLIHISPSMLACPDGG